MPIHDIRCLACGFAGESISLSAAAAPVCPNCGEQSVEKLLSASSSRSGKPGRSMPGPGDTACCGAAPGQGGCAGPGSCCGKA